MTSAIDTLKMMFDLDTYKSAIKSMFDDKYGMFGDGVKLNTRKQQNN